MPDLNFLMESRLRPEQLRVVNQLGRLAANQGLNLYLAGGAVRDLTLGAAMPRDLHFVMEGNIQKILKALEAKPSRRPAAAPPHAGESTVLDLHPEHVSLDSKLNRAQVVFEKVVKAEISAARNETYGSPGRPPVISPGTVFDDLRRRDFSVNAMAVSLHPNSRGLLLDPTNGAADIERKELRALHSRSFFDDPSRIYRLLRLCQRLDFKPDEKTERWLGMALEEKTWQSLSEDTQGAELRAILQEESCGKILKLLKDKDLLAGLDRKLAGARLEFDKFERIRAAARIVAASDEDLLTANFKQLVARVQGPEQNRLAKKILGDAKTIKLTLGLEHEAGKLAKLLGGAKGSKPSQVYTLLVDAPKAVALLVLAHYPQPGIQNRVKAFFTKYPAIRAALPRAELTSLGLAPGPKFDKVLEQVFIDQLDGKLKTPQQLTKALMSYGGIKAPPPPPPAPAKPAAKAKAPKAAVKAPTPPTGPPKVEAPKPEVRKEAAAAAALPPAQKAASPVKAAKPLPGKAVQAQPASASKPQPKAAKGAKVVTLKPVPPPKNLMPRAAAKPAKTTPAAKPKSAPKPAPKVGSKAKPKSQKAATTGGKKR